MAPTSTPQTPFGRVLTAMVTPFTADGALDLDGAQRLAAHLVDAGNDGLVVNGTTGESPTTSDAEKSGSYEPSWRRSATAPMSSPASAPTTPATASSWPERRRTAGAHGLLAVTPYYNKPPQEGLFRHFTAIADATDLPVMLYDIPGRSGVPINTETLVRLAEHPRIVANKDAKGDLGRPARGHRPHRPRLVLRRRHAEPAAALGRRRRLRLAWSAISSPPNCAPCSRHTWRVTSQKATEIHQQLLPVFTGMFRTQGVITTKAALALQGLPPARCGSPGRAHCRGISPAQDRSRRRRGRTLNSDFTTEYGTPDLTTAQAARMSCAPRAQVRGARGEESLLSHPHPELGAPPSSRRTACASPRSAASARSAAT